MNWDKNALAQLHPVIESARRELRDMDADDVPVALRRVVRSSARTLPPPLAKSVAKELMENDWFRDAVRERYVGGDDPDPDLVAFLEDPETGIESIEVRAGASEAEGLSGELDAARREISQLSSQLAEAKRRMDKLRAQHDHEVGSAREAGAEGRQRLEHRNRKLERELSDSRIRIRELEETIEDLRAEMDDVQIAMVRTSERLRRRADGQAASDRSNRSDATPSDPVEFARWIDTIERNARPFRDRQTQAPGETDAAALFVPAGVAPDSGSALGSLIDQRPDRFLLDGYNIAGLAHGPKFSTREARDAVVSRAGRLARSTVASVVVVFDGPNERGRASFRSPEGVVVRFSRGDKADDVIAQMVAREPDRTVVITSDRELRERCTVPGCVPVWSSAFLDW